MFFIPTKLPSPSKKKYPFENDQRIMRKYYTMIFIVIVAILLAFCSSCSTEGYARDGRMHDHHGHKPVCKYVRDNYRGFN